MTDLEKIKAMVNGRIEGAVEFASNDRRKSVKDNCLNNVRAYKKVLSDINEIEYNNKKILIDYVKDQFEVAKLNDCELFLKNGIQFSSDITNPVCDPVYDYFWENSNETLEKHYSDNVEYTMGGDVAVSHEDALILNEIIVQVACEMDINFLDWV